MKNRNAAAALLIMVLLASASCGNSKPNNNAVKERPSPSPAATKQPFLSQSEELLLHYIQNRQTGEYGVFTNRLDSSQTDEVATGHEVLSESAGLLMRYYARKGDQASFRAEWDKARQVFDQKSGFSYRYSPKQGKRYPANAAIDDLRIIKALREGAEIFRNKELSNAANTYAKRFIVYNLPNGKPVDFYDEQYGTSNSFITLCYIDLAEIGELPLSKRKGEKLDAELLAIVEDGYLSDSFPFYETRYSYDSGQYSSEGIRTVESLLTVLSLAEIGKHKEATVQFLKQQVQKGTLWGMYTKQGKPDSEVQSTALYAIAAMIGAMIDDWELYDDSIDRMKRFQVMDPGSELYGGFGDPATGQAYSFDNLMALSALSLQRY
ncbi:hypothetical protein ACFQZE_11965 [Paenibacillus sp. GCM10027627]|uniref:hypothetical protein n=1 Tax=unclassified Paenibacillus TaxID=185978 RepID=UPI003644E177